MNKLQSKTIKSPVGELTLVASSTGLHAILWENDFPLADRNRVPLGVPFVNSNTHPILNQAEDQLNEYFSGDRREFDLPLVAINGTSFQQRVWNLLKQIPYGETMSYGQLAARLGDPNKARAVGAANGKNPISIVVPCHRVIGQNGDLTGFAGSVPVKRFLLNLESR